MKGDLHSKTTLKRLEQYRDRWTSFGASTGLIAAADKLSLADLRRYEIFDDYDDAFLERISPDLSVARWSAGSVLFEEGSYIDLAFFIVSGEVEVFVRGLSDERAEPLPIFDLSRTALAAPVARPSATATAPLPSHVLGPGIDGSREITFLATMDFDLPAGSGARLGSGEILGEIGAMSGWPQSVTARTVTDCEVVQVRLPALRLMKRKSKGLRERLDRLYRQRSLAAQLKSTPLFRDCSGMFIEGLKATVELISLDPDEVLVRQGEPVDALYLVRSGFVKLAQHFGEGEIVVSYLSKGMTLGEAELMIDELSGWETTATSVEYAELVKLPGQAFAQLLRAYPEVEEGLWRTAADRIREAGFAKRNIAHSEFTQVALDAGLVQGSSMLVIDLESCTRCDDCVRACAATHDGRPRFVREGDKYKSLLIAKSCYHCRDPVCLVGCPTGAIHRAGVGDVVEIEDGVCIGCSTCANNCPYDAIVMHDTGQQWPGDMIPLGLRGKDRKVASKCDLCHDTGHGPACVSNCPQGCAFRVGSVDEFQKLLEGKE